MKMRWYQSNIAVWVFSLFLPPLGLALAFIYKKSLPTKLFSAAMVVFFVVYIANYKPNPTNRLPSVSSEVSNGYDTSKIRMNVELFVNQIWQIEQQVYDIEMRYSRAVGNMSIVDRIALHDAAKECFDALTPYWLEAQNLKLPAVPTKSMEDASDEARKALELSLFTRRQRCKMVMEMADKGNFSPSAINGIKEKNKETDAWVNKIAINVAKLKEEAGL